jgi:PTS system glucose-specific IIC component
MAIKVREKRVTVSGPKEFFSKLSRGLMLPIALLPIAGLFLGIGAGVENIILQVNPDATAAALLFPDVVKSIGDIIFGNLPTLFCLGVVVAFADDAGVAVLAGVVG